MRNICPDLCDCLYLVPPPSIIVEISLFEEPSPSHPSCVIGRQMRVVEADFVRKLKRLRMKYARHNSPTPSQPIQPFKPFQCVALEGNGGELEEQPQSSV